MKFLFDNNLPPALARGMRELSSREALVDDVVPLRDKFPANTPDDVWLPALADEGGWAIISIDRFSKSAAERELIRRHGLTVFVLDPQWSKPYWDQAAQLVKWWPKIIVASTVLSRSAMRVPWKFTNKSTFLGIRP